MYIVVVVVAISRRYVLYVYATCQCSVDASLISRDEFFHFFRLRLRLSLWNCMRFHELSRDRSDGQCVGENALACATRTRNAAHYIPARRNEGILFSVEF